jgi:hypothetical protein
VANGSNPSVVNITGVIYVHFGDKVVPITTNEWKLVSDFIESEITESGNPPQTH